MQKIISPFTASALLLTILLTLITACKEDDNTIGCDGPTFNALVVKNLNGNIQTNAPSSKIQLFLKVETADGAPVADLLEKDFSVWERDRNHSCFDDRTANKEVTITIEQDPQEFRFTTMLVLDLSKSVTSDFFNELKASTKSFVQSVMPDNAAVSYSMGIWWFDGSADLHLLKDFTSDKTELLATLDALSPQISGSPNSTDLYGAIISSTQIIKDRLIDLQQQQLISGAAVVLFSDGNDQAGRNDKSTAQSSVMQNKNTFGSQLRLYAIGIGQQQIEDLKLFGVDAYASAADKTTLESTFTNTAKGIRDEANSYYAFEYCSSARDGAGDISLKIMATNPTNGQKGVYSGVYNATGFGDNCQ